MSERRARLPQGGSRFATHSHPFISWRHQMKKLILAMLGAAFILTGCNTMAGLGEDTQAAGRKLEASAEKNKNYRP
jgi:predicted small secreted protein